MCARFESAGFLAARSLTVRSQANVRTGKIDEPAGFGYRGLGSWRQRRTGSPSRPFVCPRGNFLRVSTCSVSVRGPVIQVMVPLVATVSELEAVRPTLDALWRVDAWARQEVGRWKP